MKHPKKRRAKLFAGKSGLGYKSIKVAWDKTNIKHSFFHTITLFNKFLIFLGLLMKS